jgi:hypothetical protein
MTAIGGLTEQYIQEQSQEQGADSHSSTLHCLSQFAIQIKQTGGTNVQEFPKFSLRIPHVGNSRLDILGMAHPWPNL